MNEMEEIKNIEKDVMAELDIGDPIVMSKLSTNKFEIKEALKDQEEKVVEIIESCKLQRNVFISKKELIKKLEEAFPEK